MNSPTDAITRASDGDSKTYERIAAAITFMRQNYLHQPDLETVARHVHLSEYHFQRVFTRWAGISPKRFLQYLTVEYAKAKIAETKSLLELTLEVGLSSSGRLHDLFVTLEAMSPGEFKASGGGTQIWYGVHETPFGACLLATTARGICDLHFFDAADQEATEQALYTKWSKTELIRDQNAAREISDRLFKPGNRSSFVLHVQGTNFQIQVWRALLRLPFGSMTTYQGLANSMGRPTAARAVGSAIGSNAIGYLIPCHRVIRASGAIGGYRWGLERKAALLGWEASLTNNSAHELP